jgi:hypothetical protein
MSFTRTAKAFVTACSVSVSEQVTVDLTVTLYQIHARVLESQDGDDVYMVTVVKPDGRIADASEITGLPQDFDVWRITRKGLRF